MNVSVEIYQLTSLGYVTALKISGRSNEPQFSEMLGKLCKVLKGRPKGRTDFALISFQDLVRESGVFEAFAYNVLDADLVARMLGRIGATGEGEHLVIVPHDSALLRYDSAMPRPPRQARRRGGADIVF
jgi:hypothetical protein